MNLLADEGVDRPIVERLRHEGFDVLYVAELEPGISDEMVLAWANEHDALLITLDKDFGEMVFLQKRLTAGVVLLRLNSLSSERRTEIVLTFLRSRATEMVGNFSVITLGAIRIRRKQ